MNFSSCLSWLLDNLSEITVAFAIISAIASFFIQPVNGGKRDLEFTVNKAFSGAALPTGLALLGCAFKPELLSGLDGASLNVAVAGITLLFISVKSVFFAS
jgi:hypothetical protein